MPKRTNPFQQLAAIIHSHLGSGWNVTESMLLTDSITGEMREVDVVAKATVGTYDIYISVECTRNCIDIAHQLHLKMLTNCIEK